MDMDRACEHMNFGAEVDVGRLTSVEDGPVTAYVANITVMCMDCGEKFRFIGVEAGAMPSKPMCSVDETELRAPIRPASSDPDFGLGIPGFAVQGYDQKQAVGILRSKGWTVRPPCVECDAKFPCRLTFTDEPGECAIYAMQQAEE